MRVDLTGAHSRLASICRKIVVPGSIVVVRGALVGSLAIDPLEPVITKQLVRVRRANGAVAAGQIRSGTVLVAPPARALWMTRI